MAIRRKSFGDVVNVGGVDYARIPEDEMSTVLETLESTRTSVKGASTGMQRIHMERRWPRFSATVHSNLTALLESGI